MSTARLSLTMNTMKLPKRMSPPEAPAARADRLAAWILLALGLLLMLVSVGKAEEPSATRVQRFSGSLAEGQTIRVDNVSGDIVASAGRDFSAVVTLTVSAATQQKADEILKKTEIVGEHDDEGWNLETVWPGRRSGGRGDRRGSPCERCRISARYELVVPPGVTVELQTVNGDVRVRDVDGELNLETVNGSIDVGGARRSLSAQTVNGRIEAAAQALSADAEISLQTVNGTVALTLPKDARFDLEASTMNGTIASTFPLPARAADTAVWVQKRGAGGAAKTPSPDRPSTRVLVEDEDGETRVIDLSELDHELAESMKKVEISIEQGMHEDPDMREFEKQIRHIRVPDPRREYNGSIGKGGTPIHLETLNGTVLLLAAGTKEADAKPLVSERRSFVVTVPEVRVRVGHPAPPVPPVAPVPGVPPASRSPRAPMPPLPPLPPEDEAEIVRGDISGDFLSTSTDASYRIGNVSGRARILSHSGELRIGSVGSGAELKTFGGDIVVGAVTGDLKASTMAGDIRSGPVSGSALADTAGGDIRIERVGASLDAKTGGGDIVVPRVGGSVRAVTAGGDVRIGVSSNDIKGGVTIHNSGGDVTLTLPASCKADVELVVSGTDENEQAIRSEFPTVTVSKKPGSQRATLSLNGGGEKVVVKTSSGTIRLKKATS